MIKAIRKLLRELEKARDMIGVMLHSPIMAQAEDMLDRAVIWLQAASVEALERDGAAMRELRELDVAALRELRELDGAALRELRGKVEQGEKRSDALRSQLAGLQAQLQVRAEEP